MISTLVNHKVIQTICFISEVHPCLSNEKNAMNHQMIFKRACRYPFVLRMV